MSRTGCSRSRGIPPAAPARQRRPPADRSWVGRSAWLTTALAAFQRRRSRIDALRGRLETTRVGGETLDRLLRRPTVSWDDLVALHPALGDVEDGLGVVEQVNIEAKYGGYIERQTRQIERFRGLEAKTLPSDLDYARIPQLRAEAHKAVSGSSRVARSGRADQRDQSCRSRHASHPHEARPVSPVLIFFWKSPGLSVDWGFWERSHATVGWNSESVSRRPGAKATSGVRRHWGVKVDEGRLHLG